MREGRGFVIRTARDTPWAGWMGLRALDARVSLRLAPWRALGALAEACEVFPGGLALVWDGPTKWLAEQPAEDRAAFLGLLARLPGLSLHVADAELLEDLDAPLRIWLHASEPPRGGAGHAWRQGWCGWVPRVDGGFALPGLGRTQIEDEQVEAAALWGEAVLPVGALAHVDPAELALALTDLQAGLERALSQRVGHGMWPMVFPFQRRRTGWRIGLVGGREFGASGGNWEEAAGHLERLGTALLERMRCPIHVVASEDAALAASLGHQAMREGHPWRATLPMPPGSPVFSCGLGTDPREPSPLESRAFVPGTLAAHLAAPPVARLRVPSLPGEAAVHAFLRYLHPMPALQWMPGTVPPPPPYLGERPWSQASAYPPVPDVTSALQPALFKDLDWE